MNDKANTTAKEYAYVVILASRHGRIDRIETLKNNDKTKFCFVSRQNPPNLDTLFSSDAAFMDI